MPISAKKRMNQIQTPIWQFRAIENFLRSCLVKELVNHGDSVAQIGASTGLDFGKLYVLSFYIRAEALSHLIREETCFFVLVGLCLWQFL